MRHNRLTLSGAVFLLAPAPHLPPGMPPLLICYKTILDIFIVETEGLHERH
jgi:hypothetical protein